MSHMSAAGTVTEITTEAGLRDALGGYPSGRVVKKERTSLHPLQVEWLRAC